MLATGNRSAGKKLYTLHQSSQVLSSLSPDKKDSVPPQQLDFSSNSHSLQGFDAGDNDSVDLNTHSVRDLRYRISLLEIDNRQLSTRIKFLQQKLQKSEEHNKELIQKVGSLEVENKQTQFHVNNLETHYREIQQEAQELATKHDELVEQYGILKNAHKGLNIDVYNVKQTLSHLCESVCQSPTQLFMRRAQGMISEISRLQWEDGELGQLLSHMLQFVCGLFRQNAEMQSSAKKNEHQIIEIRRKYEQIQKNLTEAIKAKEKIQDQHKQYQIRVMNQKQELYQQLHCRYMGAVRDMAPVRDMNRVTLPRQMPSTPIRLQEPQWATKKPSARINRNTEWERGRLKNELEQIDSDINELQNRLMKDILGN